MEIKLMQYNVQDLFLRLDYPIGSEDLNQFTERQWQLLGKADTPLKPLHKCRSLAAIIAAEEPDICMISEVGGQESLENFNSLFLKDGYRPLIFEGQSRRGIHNGFLVRKGFTAKVELRPHPEWLTPFYYPHEDSPANCGMQHQLSEVLELGEPMERRISRDVLELRVKPVAPAPTFSILLTHLKSGFDPAIIDPGGVTRRTAEVLALIEIYEKVRMDLDGGPVIIAGDFNGNASRDTTAPEFMPIYEKTDLDDALWLADIPRHDRITHVTFVQRKIFAKQLDYIFLPAAFHNRVLQNRTYVYRYKGSKQLAKEIGLPWTFADRNRLPSDHYPIICTLVVN